MKKLYFLLFSFFLVAAVTAQIENPVKWSYTAKKVSDKVFDVYVTAALDPKWHIYAQEAGEGPVSTSFAFNKNPLVVMDGKVKETGKIEKKYDENFKSVLKFYAGTVSFIQRVKLKSAVNTVVTGAVEYMVCNDSKCLPPKEIKFSVPVNAK
jgi:thiol:disulfide interchange protein DsbD